MCCFWENIKKKQAALNAIAAHCVFKINASFYLFIFFIIHFFFSRLLQAPASEHLPDITKKFRTCRTTFNYFEGHAVSTIFQTSPYPPPPPRHYKVQNLCNVRLSCKPKCEMRQVTCKILCYLFRFIRNEARQSLIIILIKPTSCLYLRRLCTNE